MFDSSFFVAISFLIFVVLVIYMGLENKLSFVQSHHRTPIGSNLISIIYLKYIFPASQN